MSTSSRPGASATGQHPADLGPIAASVLVFGASAAVLIVELVALRLLAPYLGLTLETTTLVIGVALTAIAIGAWWGGRAADAFPPRRALGPLLAVSGVAVAATPVLVRTAGSAADRSLVLATGILAIFVPGALLSAVTPMVTKLRLSTLAETGTVVGRLSGIATAGAIAGTVLTGFVLVSWVPVSGILVSLGLGLVLASAVVEARVRGWRTASAPAVMVLLGALGAAVAPGGCDQETRYHCAVVTPDPGRDGGRTLVLDGLRHSYIDLGDPRHLDFDYLRAVAAATDVAFGPGEPITAFHLGGGALTLPRFLDEVRPGTTSVVSEIDPGVVELSMDLLGRSAEDLEADGLEIRVEDGRLGLRRLATNSQDLVMGDAFGGVSVPWHLTTREAVADIRRVLNARGVYAVNLIDHGRLAFARSAVATIAETFEHTSIAAAPETLAGEGGGNVVVIATGRSLPATSWRARIAGRHSDWEVISGAALEAWSAQGQVLTDAHAPVDQLLTPYGR